MLHFRKCLIAFAFVIGCSNAGTQASEIHWPGWLGPNRNGHVSPFQAPSPWPDKLRLVWQKKVGLGSGTPLVDGDRIYLQTREGEDEIVACLDLKTGNRQWRKNYPVPYQIPSPGERYGNGPNANPAYADGRLFTFSITGILSAWEVTTGKQLWQHTYEDHYSPTHPQWGHSTSPLVDGDQVLIHIGNEETGALVAYDASSGEEIWRDGEEGACHASPILAPFHGVRQVVEWNHEAVVGLESQTGRRLWSYDLPHRGSNQNSPTPVFYQGRLLVGAENRGIRSLEPRLAEGQWSVVETWQHREVSLNMASAIISGDSLYGQSHLNLGQFFRLNPLTGKVIWFGPERMGNYATFLSTSENVFAQRVDGRLIVLKSGDDIYRPLATYKTASEETWAAPVLLPDGLLIKDRSTLYRWRF